MRLYVPALAHDLSLPVPPSHPAFLAVAPTGASGEDIEDLEDDAQTLAALASLDLLRDAPTPYLRRIVMAVDLPISATPSPTDTPHIATLVPPTFGWGDVVALLIDEDGADDWVQAVISADTQDGADQAVAALWEHSLQWFDISERPALLTHWGLTPER